MNIEEIKKQKDGLDVLRDIYRYAELGREAITPEDEALFRWYGIYTQRPAEDGYFMVRTRIPGGDLTPVQLRKLADLANRFGNGLADVTVRQNIQYHWVRVENLGVMLDELNSVGLSTTEACGDCVRNIINCPVSGAAHDELYDTTDLIGEVDRFFINNRDFSNLPRKFKIAITGCAARCTYPEINDIGLFAVREEGEIYFRARVGGGLSTAPRFAKDLGVLVKPEESVELCAAIAQIFRDWGNRDNRKRARLKFLVEKWEIPRFRTEVENVLGRQLKSAAKPDAEFVRERDRTHSGVHQQRENGLYYVGLSLLGGRTSGDKLLRLADLAEQFGSGRIRTSNQQNIYLLDVPQANLPVLQNELNRLDFDFEPHWARRGMIACTGTEFCKLAVSETKNRAVELADLLEKSIKLDNPVRISVTGCPNSCGQHHVCDIGLEGSVTTIDGVKQETFQVFLGGGVGAKESFGRRTGARIPSEKLAGSLINLFNFYNDTRQPDENFQDFCLRFDHKILLATLTVSAPTDLTNN